MPALSFGAGVAVSTVNARSLSLFFLSPTTTHPLTHSPHCTTGILHNLPVKLPTSPHSIRRIAIGSEHALALSATGLVLSWGANDCGQLGCAHTSHRNSPHVIRTLATSVVVEVAAGARCSGAICAAGWLWSWGSQQPASLPSRFHSSWANASGRSACGKDCRAVAYGDAHSLVLTTAGDVWCVRYELRTTSLKPDLLSLSFRQARNAFAPHCART